ncbi:MAG: glycosyltransferase family 2 protein, partial [Candidatus Riflebacteria bacterium]|nr:glycosyltransferase family 2 protein [Candidatus Riflebacteria bacterium]
MKDISLFIITKNEGDKIKKCIESAAGIVSEIIVVDSDSTDNTVETAKSLGAKVYQREFTGFAEQKNFALSKCTGKWALSLDADESLTKELAEEISAISDEAEANGYYLLRINYFLGGRM